MGQDSEGGSKLRNQNFHDRSPAQNKDFKTKTDCGETDSSGQISSRPHTSFGAPKKVADEGKSPYWPEFMTQLSSVQNPGWLFYIEDYTTQFL